LRIRGKAMQEATPVGLGAMAALLGLDFEAASAVAAVYTAEEVNLQGQAVYSVFVLGGNASATGLIRKER
jgi:hypothetical protein